MALLIDLRRARRALFNDRYGSERLYIARARRSNLLCQRSKGIAGVARRSSAPIDDRGVAEFPRVRSDAGEAARCSAASAAARRHYVYLRRTVRSSTGHGTSLPAEWEAQARCRTTEFEDRIATLRDTTCCRATWRATPSRHLASPAGLDTRMIMACLPDATDPSLLYVLPASRGRPRPDSAQRWPHLRPRAPPPAHRRGFLSRLRSLSSTTVFGTDGCAGALRHTRSYLTALARQLCAGPLDRQFRQRSAPRLSTFKLLASTACSSRRSRHVDAPGAIDAER